MFCLKGRRVRVSSYRKLRCSSDLSLLLCRRFSIATSYLLNRSVFSISVSDVDSDFSLRHGDIEAVEENDEWWVALQLGIL